MAINVNRVAVGFNCKSYNTDYFRRVAKSCPVTGTVAAQLDGSFLICKAGGVAWFVAPASTIIQTKWANGCYNGVCATDPAGLNKDISCISEWGVLGSCLSARGYVPTEWFVPCLELLQNPAYECRINFTGLATGARYWHSTEICSGCGGTVYICQGSTATSNKNYSCFVRAFRCVTY